MKKHQLLYYQYVDPIIELVRYIKHFIQARLRWMSLKLFPPKNCRDHRLNMDPYMLETLPDEQRNGYINNLQKIRDATCRKRCETH